MYKQVVHLIYFQNYLQRRNHHFSPISDIEDTKHHVTLYWSTIDQWQQQKASCSAASFSKMCWELSYGSGLTGVGNANAEKETKTKSKLPKSTLILVFRNHSEAVADSMSNLRGHTWGWTLVSTSTKQNLQGVREENLPVFTDLCATQGEAWEKVLALVPVHEI